MKIARLSVNNFLGIGAVNLTPAMPVVMVAGPNAAGKTSLYQAIRLAMLNDVPRIDLMRESGSLVKAGTERGVVQVQAVNGAGEEGLITVSLPDRKRSGPEALLALRWSLEPHAFAMLEPKERMRTVLALSKNTMKKEALVERLAARGIAPNVIEELRPQLVLGFDALAEMCKSKAAESRGMWKAATGESYGSKKGAIWTAPASPELPEQPMSMDDAIAKAESTSRNCAAAEALAETLKKLAADRERDKGLAARVKPLTDRIEVLRIEAGPEEPAPRELHKVECPHCQCDLWLTTAYEVVADPGPAKPKKMTAAQRAKIKSELAMAEKELVSAQGAAARLADPQTTPEPPLLDEARTARDEAADVLRSLRSQWDAFEAVRKARESNAHKEGLAKGAHLAVQAWEAAEAAFAPSGIPSELMSAAMGPLRAAIRQVCASDAVGSWPLPDVADDGSISARGRPYALLSRSEQYRVDLVLAAALAVVSGTRILAADEADILEPKARGELLDWLLDMTEATLESAWVFLTLKAPAMAPEGAVAYWIVDGANAQP